LTGATVETRSLPPVDRLGQPTSNKDTPMKKMIGVAMLGIALMTPLAADVADAEASMHSMVLCGKFNGGGEVLVKKPRSCVFNYRAGVRYKQTIVLNIRWRNWGGPASCGRGTIRGNSGYRAPLRFCLVQRTRWEEDVMRYTRLRGVVGKGCYQGPSMRLVCGVKPYRRHIRAVV
jgi:hypothetical protein